MAYLFYMIISLIVFFVCAYMLTDQLIWPYVGKATDTVIIFTNGIRNFT